jgi:hypothetical protein
MNTKLALKISKHILHSEEKEERDNNKNAGNNKPLRKNKQMRIMK